MTNTIYKVHNEKVFVKKKKKKKKQQHAFICTSSKIVDVYSKNSLFVASQSCHIHANL